VTSSGSAAEQTTLLVNDLPFDLPNSFNQEVDCSAHSFVSEGLPDPLACCGPAAVTSNIKTEDTMTSCGSVEDAQQFVSLLPSTDSLSDGDIQLSKDTEQGIPLEPAADGVAKSEEPAAGGRERVIHMCDHCGKSFVRVKEYVEHRRTHTGERPFHCETCGRGFSRLRSVAVHRRQHTGERPFVCDVCAKQFVTSGELLKHRRYHSGERLYRCSTCGKEFLRSGEYADHRRVHAGENVCPVCGKVFTRLHNMKEHLSSAHVGTKPYRCATCGKQFAYSSGLRYHRRLHKADRPFKCLDCEKCFARMGELNRHRRGTHKIVNLPKLL